MSQSDNRRLLSELRAGSVYSVETLDRGMSYVLGGAEGDRARFHPATQNSMQFRTSEMHLSGIVHLIFQTG